MNKKVILVEHITLRFNRFLGSSRALLIGLAIMALWALSFLLGSDWHLGIVEIVAMLGFLNIFIVQRAQNKDLQAIHVKLDELIMSSNRASNLLVKVEESPEYILEKVRDMYKSLAQTHLDNRSINTIKNSAVEEILETPYFPQTDNSIQAEAIREVTIENI